MNRTLRSCRYRIIFVARVLVLTGAGHSVCFLSPEPMFCIIHCPLGDSYPHRDFEAVGYGRNTGLARFLDKQSVAKKPSLTLETGYGPPCNMREVGAIIERTRAMWLHVPRSKSGMKCVKLRTRKHPPTIQTIKMLSECDGSLAPRLPPC